MIVDITMPVINGLEVCRRIRQKPFGFITPIIILSVKDSLHEKVEGLCLGADEYLTKPFYTEGVMKRIPIVMEYKMEKLAQHPLTGLPGFLKCCERFDRLTGSDNYFVYMEFNDYFKHITGKTKETIASIKKISEVLKKLHGKNDIFHLEGSNFCYFINKKKFKKNTRKFFNALLADFSSIHEKKEDIPPLHLILFSMKTIEDSDIKHLAGPIQRLQRRIKDDTGNLVINEDEEIFRDIFFEG